MFEKRCFYCGGKIHSGEYKVDVEFLLMKKLAHESCWKLRQLEEFVDKLSLEIGDKFIRKSDIKDYIEKEIGITTKW